MTDTQAYWLFSIGIPLAAIGVFLLVARAVISRRTGARIHRSWVVFLLSLASLFVAGQAIYDHLNAKWQEKLSLGYFVLMTIICWDMLLRMARTRHRGGPVLLDLGFNHPARKRVGLVFALIGVCAAVNAFVQARSSGFHDAPTIIQALMWSSSVILFLDIARTRARIHQDGIETVGGFFPWERIVSYEWVGERLILRLRRRVPVLGMRPGTAFLPVPPQHHEEVAQLLARYLPASVPSRATMGL